MSERYEQAAAEAERITLYSEDRNYRHLFMEGVDWADAHPQPRTITAERHAALVDSLVGATVGSDGALTHLDSSDAEGIVQSLLHDLGIEVVDG